MEAKSDRLHKLNYSFKSARVVQVAVKIGLFTRLQDADAGLTCQEVASEFNFSAERGVRDFLDILVANDLLQTCKNGETMHYHNSSEATQFLTKGQPDYMGDVFLLSHDRTWQVFTDLLPALQEGEIVNSQVPKIKDTIYKDGKLAYDFALGMASTNSAAFQSLASQLDFSQIKNVVDIGGSIGEFMAALFRAHPHLHCTTCDLPFMTALADQHLAKLQLQDKILTRNIDFLKDPFPEADLIVTSMVLHNWRLEVKTLLIKKAYTALKEGGIFLEVNSIVGDDHQSPLYSLELSMTQLVEFGKENAFVYTFEEFTSWAKEAGFSRTKKIQLTSFKFAAIAYK